eukprot:1631392-Prymnesium_polylepis.1
MKGGSPPSSIFGNTPFHRSALCLLTGLYPPGRVADEPSLEWARLIAHIEQEDIKLYGGRLTGPLNRRAPPEPNIHVGNGALPLGR